MHLIKILRGKIDVQINMYMYIIRQFPGIAAIFMYASPEGFIFILMKLHQGEVLNCCKIEHSTYLKSMNFLESNLEETG